MNVGSFSVRNPVLINILMVTILLLGAFSIQRLPKEQFAEVPFYWANIIVPYPGVAAEDVEETVTVPIENQYSDIDKLKRIQSV
ncbi:MAG: efflux RND transporter permease subunit, partial [Sediminispirochaetaceae bacterium]